MRLRARLSLAAAGVLIAFVLSARVLMGYISPFLLALVFAAVIDPIVDTLESRGISRSAGALTVIASLGLGFAGLTWILAVNVIREVELLRVHLPEYTRSARRGVEYWTGAIENIFSELPHPFDDALVQGAEGFVDTIGLLASHILTRAGSVPGGILIVVVAATATYFLSRDKRELGAFLFHLLPKGWHPEVRRLKEEIVTGLLGFVRAQCILVALSGALSVAGLWVFGYRYAWLLGILAGILDLVPMVGPSGVFAPLVLLGVVEADWARTLGVGCVWASVLLVRQIVEPDIVGRHVGLHPLTSIVAVYLGGKLFGVNGVIMGPVVAVTLKAICVVSILPHIRQE